MKLKPNILNGLESVLGANKINDYVNESEDNVLIEDSSGRIKISEIEMQDLPKSNICSGVFAAIM